VVHLGCDPVSCIAEKPFVEVVVCTRADIIVEVAACIKAGVSAALSAKIPGWLTFPPRPGGLSPLHVARGPLVQADPFSAFARVIARANSS